MNKAAKMLISQAIEESGICEPSEVEELTNLVLAAAKAQTVASRNKARIQKADASKGEVSATEVLTSEEISALPSWVRDSISEAKIVGRSGKVIKTADGRKYHRDNKLNDLSGGQWTFFLNSVIQTRFPSTGPESFAHEIRKIHPSPKPPQLMRDIISFFTKEDGIVVDFFMGVGGTLLGASLSGRRALGVDLNSEFVNTYQKAATSLGLPIQQTIVGDALEVTRNSELISELFGQSHADLILIDPPYGDMMSRQKTGGAGQRKASSAASPYTDSGADLGNLDRGDFLRLLMMATKQSMAFLKNKGYVVVFIKDLQPTVENPNLLHAEIIEHLSKIDNLSYAGMKIWADMNVNLYPYGYPHAFVSNQIHQYILVFKKVDRDRPLDFDRGAP